MRETRREAREERRASLEAKRDARAEASQKRQERQAQKDAERSARAEASKQRKEEEAKKPKTAEERGRAKVRSVRERGDGSLFKGAALTGKDMVRDQIAGKISDAKETVMGAVGRAQAKYKAVKDTVSGIHGAVSEIRGRTAPGGDGKKTVAGSDKPDKKLAAKATPAKAAAVDKPKEPATAKKSFHPPIGGCSAKEGLNRKKSAPTPGTAACS